MIPPVRRPTGASEIVIEHHRYSRKDFLVVVFGMILVVFAVEWIGWLNGPSAAPPPLDSGSAYSVDKPIYVILTVLVDHPVTPTLTPTPTMMAWELTVEAKPTLTPSPIPTSTPRPTATRTPSPDRSSNAK